MLETSVYSPFSSMILPWLDLHGGPAGFPSPAACLVRTNCVPGRTSWDWGPARPPASNPWHISCVIHPPIPKQIEK